MPPNHMKTRDWHIPWEKNTCNKFNSWYICNDKVWCNACDCSTYFFLFFAFLFFYFKFIVSKSLHQGMNLLPLASVVPIIHNNRHILGTHFQVPGFCAISWISELIFSSLLSTILICPLLPVSSIVNPGFNIILNAVWVPASKRTLIKCRVFLFLQQLYSQLYVSQMDKGTNQVWVELFSSTQKYAEYKHKKEK